MQLTTGDRKNLDIKSLTYFSILTKATILTNS